MLSVDPSELLNARGLSPLDIPWPLSLIVTIIGLPCELQSRSSDSSESSVTSDSFWCSSCILVGGGERTWSEEEILARIDEEGVPREPYQFYIDTRTYGGVPHGGFGLGVDRVCSWLSGADHIREVIPFPRDSRRVTP